MNANEKINFWKSINIRRLFEGDFSFPPTHVILILKKGMNVADHWLASWEQSVVAWLEFISILTCTHENCACDIDQFVTKVKAFCVVFRTVKPTGVVTPYIHAFINHVVPMMKAHSSLQLYNTSGQELKNYIQTQTQFKASNQQNIPLDLTKSQLIALYFAANPVK